MSSIYYDKPEVFDTRELIERLEELEDLLSPDADLTDVSPSELEDLQEEFKALQAFAASASTSSDYVYGETCIRADYFVDYIQELVDECYGDLVPKDKAGEWPYRHLTVDWEACAEEAKVDYDEAMLGGELYLFRSV